MSDTKCPMKPSLRLENDPDIRDAVEAIMASSEAKNSTEALKILIRRGIGMTNRDSEIIGQLLKYQIHGIALSQRILGLSDEKLISVAREDAHKMYTQILSNIGEK